jgi:hypothetical protein
VKEESTSSNLQKWLKDKWSKSLDQILSVFQFSAKIFVENDFFTVTWTSHVWCMYVDIGPEHASNRKILQAQGDQFGLTFAFWVTFYLG